MHSSHHVDCRPSDHDWEIFTHAVLLVSASAKLLREELDTLIMANVCRDLRIDELRRARANMAALASVADHFNQGECP